MQWAFSLETADTIPQAVNVVIKLNKVQIMEMTIIIPVQNRNVKCSWFFKARRIPVVIAAELNSTPSSAPRRSDMNTMLEANLDVR
jgi:hypothetical protein